MLQTVLHFFGVSPLPDNYIAAEPGKGGGAGGDGMTQRLRRDKIHLTAM